MSGKNRVGEVSNIFLPNFSTGEILNSRMMFYWQKHLTKVRWSLFFPVTVTEIYSLPNVFFGLSDGPYTIHIYI